MKLLVISMMLLLTSLYTPTLLAGSMECGGRIFEDGQEVGPYKGEILKGVRTTVGTEWWSMDLCATGRIKQDPEIL